MAVAVLPLPSVTVQVTVVVPRPKLAGASLVTDATLQLSAVVGVPNSNSVAVQPELVFTSIFDGAVIVGAVISVTVTVCVAVAVLPLPSVTVQVTVVFPKTKLVGALLVTDATLQLSAVVGVPKETPVAVQPELVFTLLFDGAVIVGTIMSVTVTVALAVCTFPLLSVTVSTTAFAPKFVQLKLVLFTLKFAMVQLSVEALSTSAADMVAEPEPFRLMVMFFALATGLVVSVMFIF